MIVSAPPGTEHLIKGEEEILARFERLGALEAMGEHVINNTCILMYNQLTPTDTKGQQVAAKDLSFNTCGRSATLTA